MSQLTDKQISKQKANKGIGESTGFQRSQKSGKKMTLIIGFACKDGICLVSDTKITNPETLEPKFASKILTPLKDTPFIVGATGYTDLFHEFNRKIVEQVDQRIRQYKIANIEQLMRTGISRDEAVTIVQRDQKDMSSSQQALEEPKERTDVIESDIELPFVYTAENFLDDCKELISEITKNSGYSNPIELLLGLRDNVESFPRLYKIDATGHEETISDWTAIGSGEPFAKIFFSELYDPKKSTNELVQDCFKAITFVQDIGKENSVGYSSKFPPEAVVIDNVQGVNVYGRVRYENTDAVLNKIKNETKKFTDIVKNPNDIDLRVQNIQKKFQVAFTGYHEPQVKTAVKTILKNSKNFDIVINSNPRKEADLLNDQPDLRGCDNNDLHVYSMIIQGSLVNARNLVRMETPLGVQIDLLPQSA